MIRVVVHDRRRLYREGLERFLAADDELEVVGAAPTVEKVERLCAAVGPDAVVVQVVGDEPAALGLIARLRARAPEVRVVAICDSTQGELAAQAREAGAQSVCGGGGARGVRAAVVEQAVRSPACSGTSSNPR